MAGEIRFPHTVVNRTLKALVLGPNGTQMWNGSAMAEISAVANTTAWRGGLIALTEQQLTDNTRTGIYVGNMPAADAGDYGAAIYDSTAPSPGDVPAGVIETLPWDGSQAVSIAAVQASLTALAAASVIVSSPVATDAGVTLTQYDDYNNTEARAFAWSNAGGNWGGGDISGADVDFLARHKTDQSTIEKAGSVVSSTGTQQVRVELTSAEAGSFRQGEMYDYQVRLTLAGSGRRETIVDSNVTVIESLFGST